MQNPKPHLFTLAFVGCCWLAMLPSCTLPKENSTPGQNTSSAASPSGSSFTVRQLVLIATADKDGWMGKEVTVSGYVGNISGSGGAKGYSILFSDSDHESENQVSCEVPQGDIPKGITSTTIEVKGKIGLIHRQSYLNLRSVRLDSCEIKK